jgi:hypothetical protein
MMNPDQRPTFGRFCVNAPSPEMPRLAFKKKVINTTKAEQG